jgi:hypothetical protein
VDAGGRVEKLQEKVDIVYLWVDGSDPAWRDKWYKTYASWVRRHPHELAVYGNVLGRYRDNGELRYNLRALEKFFPDHGHVYIVTDGQTPAWLRTSDRLTIVDHRDLIPSSARPVFDSGHIASYVHRIPGLSERFFLLNDDVFFGAPVDPEFWFGGPVPMYFEDTVVPHYDEPQVHETALVNASIFSRNWMQSRYPDYRHDPRLLAHAPRAMLKKAVRELEEIAPEVFLRVRSTVFRSWQVPPLVSGLLACWMLHLGYARAEMAEPFYICSGDENAAAMFAALGERFGEIPFFCINDTCDDADDDDPRLLKVARSLEELLPEPSSFERADHEDVMLGRLLLEALRIQAL